MAEGDEAAGPQPGLEAAVEREVTAAMTAQALGSGDVPVLGTPAVLVLAEEAAVAALAGLLDADRTSVGTYAEVSHVSPTPVGSTVRATATLVEVAGRSLTFDISLTDPAGEVARIRHTRVVVGRTRFLEQAATRLTPR